MTAPSPDTGRPIALKVGAAAQLLTEYAVGDPPTVLVNISTDRAWVGSDTSVGPSNGVPLDPGTSLPWTGTGTVYAVADQGASNPIVVYITSAISGWTPSPATIAAQVATEVAAALLATGVPDVLLEVPVATTDSIGSGSSKTYTVSGFASLSLIVTAFPAVSTPISLLLSWTGPAGSNGQEYLYAIDDSGITSAFITAHLAVAGGQLRIQNQSAVAVSVTMTGSNRPAPERLTIRNLSSSTLRWSNSNAVGAAQDVTLFAADTTRALSGLVTATFKVTNGATGRFDLRTALGDTITLCDTAEMITNAAGNKYLSRLVVLPPSKFTFHFQSVAASTGGGTVSVDVVG